MEKPVVSLVKCNSYESETVYLAVEQACYEAGFPSVAGKKVLIKPNILSDVPPERAVTTHPEVLRAAIRFVQKLGGIAYVGDSPALHLPSFSGKKCGLRDVCEETGAEWVDFTRKPIKVKNASFLKKKSFIMTRAVETCDMVISLPKMKTHQLMYMTGAVKNLFGLIPSLLKSPYHMRCPDRKSFAEMLLDIYQTVTPVFSLMDAVTAMEGPGPNSGNPRHMGLILASTEALSLDFTASHIMGYDPKMIPHIKQAIKRKMLSIDTINDIHFPLDSPEAFRQESFIRIRQNSKTGFLKTILGFFHERSILINEAPKPLFNDEKCTGCGDCSEICPTKALTLIKEVKVIPDYKKCIKCYCCHEVCLFDAITIEGKETI
ncbi:MAG: DUF362 domain-containing protein [Spirochaetales bacterium]|nr:DUF362 domain-containing protein [Spirochaetales bacterium]